MKQIVSVLLVMCLLLPCAALSELAADDQNCMVRQTKALTLLMAECAGSEAYGRLYLAADSARQTVRKISEADWSEHTGGTVYVLKEGAIEAYLSAAGVSLDDFSPAVAAKIRQSVAGSVPAAALSSAGSAYAAAASALRTGTVFTADDGFPDQAIVFLSYSDDFGVLCSFVRGQDNAVSASLIPVPAGIESRLKRVMGLAGMFARQDRLFEEYPVAPAGNSAEESE